MAKYLLNIIIMLLCLLAFACTTVKGKYIDRAVLDKIIVNETTEEQVLALLGPYDDHGMKNGIEVMIWYYVVYNVEIRADGYHPSLRQTVEIYFHENGTVKDVVDIDTTKR